MRYTIGILITLLIGFATGWFIADRRAHQYHAGNGLSHSLPLYRQVMATNVAEARSMMEVQIESLVIEAWASGLLKKIPITSAPYGLFRRISRIKR
ncbi:MAG: hypothetical protein ACXW3L_06575 [Limisphaerales bacterium]